MTTYCRSDWGAAAPKPPGLTVASSPGDSLVVHHTGGGAPPATVDDAFAMLRGIQAAHQAAEYVDIAYSMAVDNAGNTYECRGMSCVPGATYGANSHTRAVVWLGGSDVVAPSDAALRAIAGLWQAEAGRTLTADATITGHRDWTATACPGQPLYDLLPTIRRYAAAPGPGPTPDEEDTMMRSMRTTTGTVILVDGMTYRVMAGGWPEVEQALRQMIAAGTVAGNPDGSPRLWDINDAGLASLVRA